MRTYLGAVVDGRQLHLTVAAPERNADDVVREHRVLWQQRAVDVRPDRVAVDRALAAVTPVVAEAEADAGERSRVRPEHGAPAGVLESDDRARVAFLGPVGDDVADAAPRAVARVLRVQVEHAGARQLGAARIP